MIVAARVGANPLVVNAASVLFIEMAMMRRMHPSSTYAIVHPALVHAIRI